MTKYIETDDRWIAIQNQFVSSRMQSHDYPKELPNLKARVAMDMAQRFGLISVKPDGEDSTGREKMLLLTPSEVVDRAVSIADQLVNEINKRGWMIPMPHPSEIYDEAKDD